MMRGEKVEIITKQYYDSIKAYCHARLSDDFHGAEDCTQEVFFILFRKHLLLNDSEKIKTWLYKTADKVISNYLRKERNRLQVPLEDVELSDDGGLLDVLDGTPLDVLTESERRMITAYYGADAASRQQIADQFSMTLPALYVAISRIKKKLKTAIDTNGMAQ